MTALPANNELLFNIFFNFMSYAIQYPLINNPDVIARPTSNKIINSFCINKGILQLYCANNINPGKRTETYLGIDEKLPDKVGNK